MARLFLELDVDGSNFISAAEMAAATTRFGGQLTPAQTQKLAEKLALMDADGDKTVSFAGERVAFHYCELPCRGCKDAGATIYVHCSSFATVD
jgi:hypothetical protein